MALPSALESDALLSHSGGEGWWFRAKEDIVQAFVRPYVGADTSVLVLGAGGGSTVRRLRQLAPGCRVLGLDIDPAAVALCAIWDPAGVYRVADLEQDPLAAPDSLDLVFALDILEHLSQHEEVLARAARCLRRGGHLVINVPSHPWLFDLHDRHLGHLRRYRPGEIEGLVENHGLHLVHSTPLFAATLLILAVWRRLLRPALRLREGESDVGVRLPRALEAALYGVARLEGWMARLRLPFGSSHFVLARKG